jgi:dihydrofolate reductase
LHQRWRSRAKDSFSGRACVCVDPLRTMGSASLVRSLLANGLVDRLRLMIFPLVCRDRGRERLFDEGDLARFDLLQTRVLDSRVVLLEYRLGTSTA